MKLFYLLTLIFISCEKEEIESPEKSVTQWISHCDSSWKVLETHVTIHWCRVGGEDLKRFEKMKGIKDSSNCPGNAITWIEISNNCSH